MLVPLLLGVALSVAPSPGRRVTNHTPRFLHEFVLPLGAYPSSIIAGPDGALWFDTYPYFTNHQATDLGIGRITIEGKQKFFLIGDGTYDLTMGHDGKIWFTNPYTYVGSSEVPTIGSLSTSGSVVQYPAPDTSPESITTGPDGDLWYVDFGAKHDVVRVNERGVTVALYRTPGDHAVKVSRGPGRSIWFDALGRRSGVGSITRQGVVKRRLGGPAYIPGPLTLGPDGRMWVSDCSYVAAVTPAFVVTLYSLPYQTSCMWGITAGPDGNLWAADFDTSSLLRIATDGSMVEYPTPTPDMMPTGITVGPDGNIWFTEIQRNTDVSKIGVLAP
jgi:virginiamycin B lyase